MKLKNRIYVHRDLESRYYNELPDDLGSIEETCLNGGTRSFALQPMMDAENKDEYEQDLPRSTGRYRIRSGFAHDKTRLVWFIESDVNIDREGLHSSDLTSPWFEDEMLLTLWPEKRKDPILVRMTRGKTRDPRLEVFDVDQGYVTYEQNRHLDGEWQCHSRIDEGKLRAWVSLPFVNIGHHPGSSDWKLGIYVIDHHHPQHLGWRDSCKWSIRPRALGRLLFQDVQEEFVEDIWLEELDSGCRLEINTRLEVSNLHLDHEGQKLLCQPNRSREYRAHFTPKLGINTIRFRHGDRQQEFQLEYFPDDKIHLPKFAYPELEQGHLDLLIEQALATTLAKDNGNGSYGRGYADLNHPQGFTSTTPLPRESSSMAIAYLSLYQNWRPDPAYRQKSIAACEYLLSHLSEIGSIPWIRHNDDVRIDGEGVKYESGWAGEALVRTYACFGGEKFLEAALKIRDWCYNTYVDPNHNYNHFVVAFLAHLYEVTQDEKDRELMMHYLQRGLLGGPTVAGRFDGHNRYAGYNGLILNGTSHAYRVLEKEHPLSELCRSVMVRHLNATSFRMDADGWIQAYGPGKDLKSIGEIPSMALAALALGVDISPHLNLLQLHQEHTLPLEYISRVQVYRHRFQLIKG